MIEEHAPLFTLNVSYSDYFDLTVLILCANVISSLLPSPYSAKRRPTSHAFWSLGTLLCNTHATYPSFFFTVLSVVLKSSWPLPSICFRDNAFKGQLRWQLATKQASHCLAAVWNILSLTHMRICSFRVLFNGDSERFITSKVHLSRFGTFFYSYPNNSKPFQFGLHKKRCCLLYQTEKWSSSTQKKKKKS